MPRTLHILEQIHLLCCVAGFRAGLERFRVNFPRSRAEMQSVTGRITQPRKGMLRLRAYGILAVSDLLSIGAAFIAARLIYGSRLDPSVNHATVMFLLIAPLFIWMAALVRAYSTDTCASRRDSISRSIQALGYAAGAILFIAYFLKAGGNFSRAIFALGLLLSLVLISIGRFFLHQPLLRMLGGSPFTTLVVLDGGNYTSVKGDVVLDIARTGFDPATRDPILFDSFARETRHADRIVVATTLERRAAWISVLKSLTAEGEILADGDELRDIMRIGDHDGVKTLIVTTGPLRLRDRIVKRGLDLAIAIPSSILLLPVFVAVAIAIRLESAGPVFFRQERIGRDNQIFRMYKFRSMFTDLCDSHADRLTSRGDARVTRVGAFIRRTSIDELPQLLNILKGEMSVVGPRPHAMSAKAADKLYWDVDPRYRHRHSIKPGLTGLAQVRGFRGNTERTEDLTNRLAADLEYVATWSVSRDLQIIFETLKVVRHSNAY